MSEGLVWLALLLVFTGISGWGWLEYQKVEAYRRWAQQFEFAKYDIYAVLGRRGQTLTWGTPTRRGPTDVVSICLDDVSAVGLQVDQLPVDWRQPPATGKTIVLELKGKHKQRWQIPFTELPLAVAWAEQLDQALHPPHPPSAEQA